MAANWRALHALSRNGLYVACCLSFITTIFFIVTLSPTEHSHFPNPTKIKNTFWRHGNKRINIEELIRLARYYNIDIYDSMQNTPAANEINQERQSQRENFITGMLEKSHNENDRRKYSKAYPETRNVGSLSAISLARSRENGFSKSTSVRKHEISNVENQPLGIRSRTTMHLWRESQPGKDPEKPMEKYIGSQYPDRMEWPDSDFKRYMENKLRISQTSSSTHKSKTQYDYTLASTNLTINECPRVNNVFFLKTHKTGSETTAQIFLRYGDVNNMSIVLPTGNWSLGWPRQLRPTDYVKSNTSFNLFCLHAVYNRTKMATLMGSDTKYISILREPWNQFKSSFSYFRWDKLIKQSKILSAPPNPVGTFLKNPNDFYRWENEVKVPYMRNFMAFDLGFPPNQNDNVSAIIQFIKEVEENFALVMILEYFDESLVLLRRALCWETTDILYLPINVRKRLVTATDTAGPLHRHFSQVDYALYGHFNKKLQQQISQAPGFYEELNYFRKLNSNFKMFCKEVMRNSSLTMTIIKSKWNYRHVLNEQYCELTRMYIPDYVARLKYQRYGIPLNPSRKTYFWPIKT